MTSALSLSGKLPLPGARNGDRSAKGEDAKGHAFAKTLADAVSVGAKKTALPRTEATEQPRLWLFDPRPAMPSAQAPLPFEGSWLPMEDVGDDRQTTAPVSEEATGETPIFEAAADETTVDPLEDETGVVAMAPLPANAAPPAEFATDAEVSTEDADHLAAAEGPVLSPPRTLPIDGEHIAAETRPLAAQSATVRPPAEPRSMGEADRARSLTAAPGDDADTLPPTLAPARSEQKQPPARSLRLDAGQPAQMRPAAPAGADGDAPQLQSPAEPRARAEAPARPEPAPARQTAAEQPIDIGGPRVTVISASTTPAPAPTTAQVLGPTSAGLVSDIAADPAWRSAAQADAALPGARPSAVNSLRIQLQPIELGTVTARLTQTGSQMSIEIQVESNDARQRLAADSDQIVKALKTLGIDVEKVTIQHTQQTAAPATAQQQGAARDMGSQQQQQAAAERGSGGRDERGTRGGNGEGTRHGGGETTADRAGGGIYI